MAARSGLGLLRVTLMLTIALVLTGVVIGMGVLLYSAVIAENVPSNFGARVGTALISAALGLLRVPLWMAVPFAIWRDLRLRVDGVDLLARI